MQRLMDFKILNWNVAGAKYLEDNSHKRDVFRRRLNEKLRDLVMQYEPHVVTLQEIVQYGRDREDIIDPPDYYDYHPFPLIDTESLSVRAKWNKLEKNRNWPRRTYFAQGNGFLFRKDLQHQPIWDLPADGRNIPRKKRSNYIERVSLESGLYFGDRDSEPRAALVAHFVYNPTPEKPLDIFVVNLHLTTLTMEREGVPEIDRRATKIRLAQLDIIFDGIISRYNAWRKSGFCERGKLRKPKNWESFDRHEPMWVLTGDFNSTMESEEYKLVQELNFMDMVPDKGTGTKAPGRGNEATLTLDYVFAGPKFVSLNPKITGAVIEENRVYRDVNISDHFPMRATIPIWS